MFRRKLQSVTFHGFTDKINRVLIYRRDEGVKTYYDVNMLKEQRIELVKSKDRF